MSQLDQSRQTLILMARIAGFSYVMYSATGLFITFGPVPVLSAFSGGDAPAAELEFMFRIGFVAEALMYTFVGISAAAMYVVLSTVSPGVAIMGAFCRLIEAAMGATFIILKYAAFAAITNRDLLTAFSDTERGALMGLFGHVHGSAIFFLLIPMAVGGVLFFSLFFRSRFIPRWLSAWGVLTYAIIGCVAASVLLFPDLRNSIMLFFLPGALFEWVVALWLLFAGINTRHWETLDN
ncbi:MAG: DUF4386 domain-containing protein [Alphaproteobacteria bacterium]|nr:DUF4386 domain-containing protein [Alphaproteobacteria bacterium]